MNSKTPPKKTAHSQHNKVVKADVRRTGFVFQCDKRTALLLPYNEIDGSMRNL